MRLKKVLSAIMGSLLLTLGVVTISNNSAKDVNAENLSVTYTIDSTTAVSTTGNAPTNSSAAYSQTYSNGKGQMTSGNSTTLVLAGYDGIEESSTVQITNGVLNITSGGVSNKTVSSKNSIKGIKAQKDSHNRWKYYYY